MSDAGVNGLSEKQVEEVLVSAPLTLGYTPNLPIMSMGGDETFMIWSVLQDVERMLAHPHVAMCMSYYKSGIANIEFEIESDSAEVKEWATKQFSRFWDRCIAQVQTAYDYGWCGHEVLYKVEDGLLAFDGLRSFSPLDVRVLTKRMRYAGLRVKNVREKGSVDLWGPRYAPAKAFWYAHRRRFNQWYGRTQLYSAWRPWRRLASTDGAEQVIDTGAYRFAIRPLVVYYPPEDMRRPVSASGSPDPVSARQVALQMGEQLKANANIALPNSLIPNTSQRKWEIEWPDNAVNVAPLIEYIRYLKDEIAYGIEVPPELMEAGETAGGYSGRAIPMEAFFIGQQFNANHIAEAWRVQIGQPLARWNFGDKVTFDISIEPILKTKRKAAMGQDAQQPGMQPDQQPGQSPGGPSPLGAPGAEQQPLQLSTVPGRLWLATEQLRSPRGRGVVIDGKFYPGGQWIPGDVVAKLSPEQVEKLKKAGETKPAKELVLDHLKEARQHAQEHASSALRRFSRTWQRAKQAWEDDHAGIDREKARHKAKAAVRLAKQKYLALEGRYGRAGAVAMVGAWVAANAAWVAAPQWMVYIAPEPFAQIVGVAEVVRAVRSRLKPLQLSAEAVETAGAGPDGTNADGTNADGGDGASLNGQREAVRNFAQALTDLKDFFAPFYEHGPRESIASDAELAGPLCDALLCCQECKEGDGQDQDDQEDANVNLALNPSDWVEVQGRAPDAKGRRYWRNVNTGEVRRQISRPGERQKAKQANQTNQAGQTNQEEQAGQTVALSTSAGFGDPREEQVYRSAVNMYARLSRRARQELAAILRRRIPLSTQLREIRALLNRYMPLVARSLADSHIAAMVSGMKRVAEALPSQPGQPPPPPPPPPPPGQPPVWRFPIIEEALADMQARNVMTRQQFDLLASQRREQAFTVAGVQAMSDLQAIQERLSESLASGTDMRKFAADIESTLGPGTFLSDAHMETVFRTNVRSAYSHGMDRVLELPMAAAAFPYEMYTATHDDRVRPEHLALERLGIQGTNIYRRDDPVYQLFKPPWDYNCRCQRIPLSIATAAAKGIREAQEWLRTGVPPQRPAWVQPPPFQPNLDWRREPALLALARAIGDGVLVTPSAA